MKGGRSSRSLLFGAVTAFVVLAAGFHVASAAGEMNYIPIEEVPGFEGQSPDFLTYLRNIFVMLVWIVGIGGMFMIALGGFWYITSAGNTARVSQAKRLIWDAIVGLALVLTAWLILHTINPDLVIFRFQSLDWSGTASTNPQPAPGTSPDGTAGGTQGNCGGMRTSGAAGSQCGIVSKELNAMLSCMAQNGGNGIDGGSVFSISSSAIGTNVQLSQSCCNESTYNKTVCKHAKGSCHFGCASSTPGYSQAIDYSTKAGASDSTLCQIAEIAWKCGAGAKIWGPRNIQCSGGSISYWKGHETHLHIPTSSCNH